MNVLAIDIRGTHVKILASGEKEARKFPSGPTMTPQMMVSGVRKLAVLPLAQARRAHEMLEGLHPTPAGKIVLAAEVERA